MPDPQTVVADAIQLLRERKGLEPAVIGSDSTIEHDLGLDSLDVAELSAILEDELERDPYSDGHVPRTVGELLGFYDT